MAASQQCKSYWSVPFNSRDILRYHFHTAHCSSSGLSRAKEQAYCVICMFSLIHSAHGVLHWEDREFSITCPGAYCSWFIFALENVRDHNTLANSEMGKHSQRELYMCRVTEYKCALFMKACFTARLGIEFNQVRLLPPLCSITLRLNRLQPVLHATRHMSTFYSISSHQVFHIIPVVTFKVYVHVSNSHLLCVNGCVALH